MIAPFCCRPEPCAQGVISVFQAAAVDHDDTVHGEGLCTCWCMHSCSMTEHLLRPLQLARMNGIWKAQLTRGVQCTNFGKDPTQRFEEQRELLQATAAQ